MPADPKQNTDPGTLPDPDSFNKLEAITKAYEEYEDTLNQLYTDFLLKISEIRKREDLRKLEKIKLRK